MRKVPNKSLATFRRYALRSAPREVNSTEYRAWCALRQRCYNPALPGYERYGGRGIQVCDRWRESFAAFLSDVGTRPSPRHSIDRINNDGHYEPGNVRWATDHEQRQNTRRNHLITYNGQTRTLTEWAHMQGMPRDTLKSRILAKWPLDRAFTQPLRTMRRRPVTTRAPNKNNKKIQINTRLYADDVAELKKRGAALDLPWQTLLRKLVRDALRPKRIS